MTSISPSPKASTKPVADDFIAVVTHVMKRSSAPLVAFVERYDLNFTQMKAMFILGNADEPLPIGKLAEMTGASLPATGRAVDALVRSGLATRTEDPDDRRVKRVEITEVGNAGVEEIYESRVATLRDFLDGLSADQLDDLATAIKPLHERMLASQHTNCQTGTEVSR
jgi:DNA-binding MarR family transcriptional regulator